MNGGAVALLTRLVVLLLVAGTGDACVGCGGSRRPATESGPGAGALSLDAPPKTTQRTFEDPACLPGTPVPLAADGTLRCRGFPIQVTFPRNASLKLEGDGAGDGLGFMLNLSPGALLVSGRPAPLWKGQSPDAMKPQLDAFLVLNLKNFGATASGTFEDARALDGVTGRAVAFTNLKATGRMEAHLVRGWVVLLLAGGTTESLAAPGAPLAKSFLASARLRVAPSRDLVLAPRTVTGAGRLTFELPEDAYPMSSGSRDWIIPSAPAMVKFLPNSSPSPDCRSQFPRDPAALESAVKPYIPPSFSMTRVTRADVGSSFLVRIEGAFHAQSVSLYATALIACRPDENFLLIVAATSEKEAAALADGLVRSARAPSSAAVAR